MCLSAYLCTCCTDREELYLCIYTEYVFLYEIGAYVRTAYSVPVHTACVQGCSVHGYLFSLNLPVRASPKDGFFSKGFSIFPQFLYMDSNEFFEFLLLLINVLVKYRTQIKFSFSGYLTLDAGYNWQNCTINCRRLIR